MSLKKGFFFTCLYVLRLMYVYINEIASSTNKFAVTLSNKEFYFYLFWPTGIDVAKNNTKRQNASAKKPLNFLSKI